MIADTVAQRSTLNLPFPHDVCHHVHAFYITNTYPTKLFFAFSDIHDLRALQLAVHRMRIGLSDLVRRFCSFS